jgi:hypothetical protein
MCGDCAFLELARSDGLVSAKSVGRPHQRRDPLHHRTTMAKEPILIAADTGEGQRLTFAENHEPFFDIPTIAD